MTLSDRFLGSVDVLMYYSLNLWELNLKVAFDKNISLYIN